MCLWNRDRCSQSAVNHNRVITLTVETQLPVCTESTSTCAHDFDLDLESFNCDSRIFMRNSFECERDRETLNYVMSK